MLKRTFDLAAAAMGVLVLSPLLLVLSVVVGLTSRGGVVFRQTRIGLNGQPFKIIKFRTMRPLTGAEAGRFDAGDSSRVTPIGRLLRRTKLDELPQLFNVLGGSMSVVGPRPEVERWTREYSERWSRVHTVRPGLTDLASIEFRDEEQLLREAADPEACYRDVILPRKLAFYEAYVDDHPFFGDILIVLRTLAMLAGVGGSGSDERHSPS